MTDASIVRLAQRNRVVIPVRPNVDELVPMVAAGALEEAPGLIDFRINGGEHYFQPAISAFPHGALPHTVSIHLSAHSEH